MIEFVLEKNGKYLCGLGKNDRLLWNANLQKAVRWDHKFEIEQSLAAINKKMTGTPMAVKAMIVPLTVWEMSYNDFPPDFAQE